MLAVGTGSPSRAATQEPSDRYAAAGTPAPLPTPASVSAAPGQRGSAQPGSPPPADDPTPPAGRYPDPARVRPRILRLSRRWSTFSSRRASTSAGQPRPPRPAQWACSTPERPATSPAPPPATPEPAGASRSWAPTAPPSPTPAPTASTPGSPTSPPTADPPRSPARPASRRSAVSPRTCPRMPAPGWHDSSAGSNVAFRPITVGECDHTETDFSGYPDCRDDTIKAMQLALTLGMDRRFVIRYAADVDRQGRRRSRWRTRSAAMA